MLRPIVVFDVVSSFFLNFSGMLGFDQEFILFAEFLSFLWRYELSCVCDQANPLKVISLLLSIDDLLIDT